MIVKASGACKSLSHRVTHIRASCMRPSKEDVIIWESARGGAG